VARSFLVALVSLALLLAGCGGSAGDHGTGSDPRGDSAAVDASGTSEGQDGDGSVSTSPPLSLPAPSDGNSPSEDADGSSVTTADGDDDTSGDPAGGVGDEGWSGGSGEVVLEDSFESQSWYSGWGLGSSPKNVAVTSDGSALQGESFLRVSVPAGEHYGTSFGYGFGAMGLEEPDEVYFRYAVRFGPTWTTQDGGGGKLPGFGGTYDTAGWGGRPSDGTNGWSARGLFGQPESESSRSDGATRVGFYSYHADMTGTWGSNWYWSGGPLDGGVMQRNQWYRVEMYVKNNTPGVNDGVLRGWVDGHPVFEKTDVRFRDVERLHVEKVWFDIYYGGSWVAPADMYIDFDDVAIAVGPIG
jgi:hypothetical protein